jgi:hypothetical protein
VRAYHQICQIYGYLSNNKLRYGAITNYSKTWFLFCPNESKLCISPPFPVVLPNRLCFSASPLLLSWLTAIPCALLNLHHHLHHHRPTMTRMTPPLFLNKNEGQMNPLTERLLDVECGQQGGGRAGTSRSNNLSSEEEEKKYSLQSVERDSFKVFNVLGPDEVGEF